MWPPLPPGFGILVRSDRSAANRASGLSIIHPPIECKPLAISHLAVLHDRPVDAGAALSIDQFDGLRYRVGIFSAVLHGFEAQACTVQVRVLRVFVRRGCKCAVSFIRGPRNEKAPASSTKHEILDQKVSCGEDSEEYGDNDGSPNQGLAPAHRSSRIPLKKGWRTLPSADFARYSISASSEGSTQMPRSAIFLA
jgi:hypothetical protein